VADAHRGVSCRSFGVAGALKEASLAEVLARWSIWKKNESVKIGAEKSLERHKSLTCREGEQWMNGALGGTKRSMTSLKLKRILEADTRAEESWL